MNTSIKMNSENVVNDVVATSKKFRLACNKISLTYPQCDIDREVMCAFLKTVKSPSVVIVSRETHKDGNFHLHCYLQYDKQFTSSKQNVFDLVVGEKSFHPNIQPTKKKSDWINYITKSDSEYVAYGIDVGAYLRADKDKKSYCFYAEVIKKGVITKEMVQENPKMLKGLKNLLNDLEAYKMLPSESEVVSEPLTSVNIWGVEHQVMPRVFKQKQLWVCGSKNKGKTSFINSLIEKGYKGYEMPTNNDWTGYNDSYDFMYIDEFKGGISIQELNKVLQGNQCRLNTKGGMVMKNKNLPVFIISNYRPSEVYCKVEDDKLDTLLCRLEVIENYDESVCNVVSETKVDGNSDINITIGKHCKVVSAEVGSDIPVACVACSGWIVNGKCCCNSCDVCGAVDCAGCSLIWSEKSKKYIRPRPRKLG